MKLVGFISNSVNTAGKHTKAVVASKRLKHENDQRQRKMDRHFHRMGKLFYEASIGRISEMPDTHMQLCVERIFCLEKELEEAQRQIRSMQKGTVRR
jgi:hypothetical protein